MPTLQKWILLDQLVSAAADKDADRLRILREVVRRIKVIQLERRIEATDEMVLQVLKEITNQHRVDFEISKNLLAMASKIN